MAAKKEPTLVPTKGSVAEFLDAIEPEPRRADAARLCDLMREATGAEPVVWGGGIVGFGSYHYRYASGHQGDAPLAGFAPRKQHLVVYLTPGFAERQASTLERLGPHRASKGCLYLKALAGVDHEVLRQLIDCTVREHRAADERP
ncbi:hypothetical protein ABH931_005135 [Streptacidiphilus sp. MAP12-33]|uniref:DUF1801 domain-containing protein n=1 Tax=Streptacidiphilus sp. MAP12-33 TaxID=3156266 RepID=UPI003511B84A